MTSVTKKLTTILKVLVPLALALLLFWYLYKDAFSDTLQRLKYVNYSWVVLSLILGMLAHLVRSYRWKLLMEPTGNHPTVFRCLIALLIGYLVNLAIPRLGELSRCLVLKRVDNIPVTSSFGTVVSERVLDVLSLMAILGVTLVIEYDTLSEFFDSLFVEKLSGIYSNIQNGILFALMLLIALLIIWILFRKKFQQSIWWQKIISLARQTWLGFISITRLKNPWTFMLATLSIWVFYYFMSYVVLFAMEPTADLGWQAGLALLVMGGLGMSAPVQGGIGAFHLLVAGLLIYYGVTKEDGLSFAFLLHSTQLVLILVAGLISALVLLFVEKKSPVSKPSMPVKE